MRSKLLILLVLGAALAVAAVTGATAGPRGDARDGNGQGHELNLPDRLDLPDGWQPEGITAGRGFDLYVGSIPTGAVLRLDARTGATDTVVKPRDGRAAVGLKRDGRGRLFVAGGPTGKAFVYDARSGDDLGEFQLAAAGTTDTFVNDVALTRHAAYFTDSQRSQLYAVDTDLGSSRTIPLPDIPDEAGFNLNGIVATPKQDALLAIQTNTGRLWRIDPATGTSVPVDLGGELLENGDGLFLAGRTLYVVQNTTNQIAVVRLDERYGSGAVVTRITSTGFDVPSTITFLRGELYAVNARFGTTDPPPAKYWVTLVRR
jgi:sugar lactone lactonase YvrE